VRVCVQLFGLERTKPCDMIYLQKTHYSTKIAETLSEMRMKPGMLRQKLADVSSFCDNSLFPDKSPTIRNSLSQKRPTIEVVDISIAEVSRLGMAIQNNTQSVAVWALVA